MRRRVDVIKMLKQATQRKTDEIATKDEGSIDRFFRIVGARAENKRNDNLPKGEADSHNGQYQ